MVIYGVYIVSKSGGLIFNHDHNVPKVMAEHTFKSPADVDFKLVNENKKIVVSFGQHDGIMGGLIFNHDHNVPTVMPEHTFKSPANVDFKLVNENKKIVVSFGQHDGIMGGLIFNHDHNVPTVMPEHTFKSPANVDFKLVNENKKIVVSFGQHDGIMGGLIFNHDHNVPKVMAEHTFKSPADVDFKLVNENKKIVVSFGQHDGIMGGLIFNHDHNVPTVMPEHTFKSPANVDFKLVNENKKIVVSFGQHDGIMVGHVLIAINGLPVTGTQLDDGRDAFEVINNATNYPLTLRFTRPKVTTNEKIFLASMFYPLFALASQLSPEPKSSGIEVLEADTFKLQCFQTLTGVKFMIIAEPGQTGLESILRKIYELYTDYALKNPFYSLDMPIRCELFDTHLQTLLDQAEKSHVTNI